MGRPSRPSVGRPPFARDFPLPSRSLSRIADHPQAMVDDTDMASVVAELVAKYAEHIPGGARQAIIETMASIGQEQQWTQRYEHLATPGKSVFGETEASGYFIFSHNEDGRLYGIVRAYTPTTTRGNMQFSVKVIGGHKDGDYENVTLDDGVYRPHGPYAVLAMANPATAHGRIPRLDQERLKRQKLALTRNVLEEMVRREVMSRENQFSQLREYDEARVPNAEEIESFAREVAQKFGQGTIDWYAPIEANWVDLGLAQKWGSGITLPYRATTIRLVRNIVQSIWAGRPIPSADRGERYRRSEAPQREVLEQQGAARPVVRNVPKPIPGGPAPVAPSDTSWLAILGLDTTSLSIIIALILLVLLLVFRE